MRKLITKLSLPFRTATAKDTYTLYVGNLASAFLGFLFVLIVARALSVKDFGIFSAATNLIVILASLTDVGLSSGVINFVSASLAKKDKALSEKYMKAAFVLRFSIILVLAILVFVFASFVSNSLLATSDPSVARWVAAITLGLTFWLFVPYVLQGQKRFFPSVVMDLSLGMPRVVIAYILLVGLSFGLSGAFVGYAVSTIFPVLVGAYYLGLNFLKSKPKRKIYSNLIKFSGWLGVNRVVSSISGRLDVQMLAILIGASATGLYSISSKLASFIIVLASSFSSVLAPRLAAFGDKSKEKAYILKATLAIVPIALGVVLWVLIAEPFITTLFGMKYLDSVVVFRALALSMIPFLFATPAVTAITYAMKKPIYIGVFSFFQLAIVFVFNYLLIPIYGPLAPAITFGILYSVLAIYSWTIVVRYYWFKKAND